MTQFLNYMTELHFINSAVVTYLSQIIVIYNFQATSYSFLVQGINYGNRVLQILVLSKSFLQVPPLSHLFQEVHRKYFEVFNFYIFLTFQIFQQIFKTNKIYRQ